MTYFHKGDKLRSLDPLDTTIYQVTEVTPVGDAFVVLQLYIEGSRKQVDITNPNPPDKPGNPVTTTDTQVKDTSVGAAENSQSSPAPDTTASSATDTSAELSEAAKDLNR